MQKFITITFTALGAFALLIAASLLSVLPIYFAWNAVVPLIFGLAPLTFTQAIWLSVLSSALFKTSVPSKSDIKGAIKEAMDK